MQNRGLETPLGKFVPQPLKFDADGMISARLEMFGSEVLVLPDVIQEKIGNIFLADTTRETHGFAGQTGTIAAIGPDAFKTDRSGKRQWTGRRPEVGDRILFERYAGKRQVGLDGVEYEIMSDITIAARFVPPPAE